MSYKDPEKQRAADRRYRRSKKGKAATWRWQESHKTELAKKREEETMKRREAFWKEMGAEYYTIPLIRRLWSFYKAGRDIDFDPHNAKYIYAWINKGRFKKKKKGPSVGSRNYY